MPPRPIPPKPIPPRPIPPRPVEGGCVRLPCSADTGMSEISTDAAPGLAVEGAPIEMLADETAGPGDGIWSAQARASPRLSREAAQGAGALA